MLPILTIYADLIGMFGGFLVCTNKLGINPYMYINLTFDTLAYRDIFTGLIKAWLFGVIIAMVSCFEGMYTQGGAEGVGKSTTIAVVNSFIFIIASDCLLTAMFYFVF
jgi:phospholipid/cholesterol/gamma-HCH transport system permease protein